MNKDDLLDVAFDPVPMMFHPAHRSGKSSAVERQLQKMTEAMERTSSAASKTAQEYQKFSSAVDSLRSEHREALLKEIMKTMDAHVTNAVMQGMFDAPKTEVDEILASNPIYGMF